MLTLSASPAPSKTCTKCGLDLPLSCFWPRKDQPGHFKSRCATCCKEDNRARYKANPSVHAAATVAWNKANPGKVAAIHRRFVEKHRVRLRDEARAKYAENRREKKAEYRKANAEKIKARNVEYRESHRDELRAAGRAYYAANKSAVDERIRLAVSKKPHLYKAIGKAAKHRRRARIIANGPVESFKDREIFERDGWICGLCGKPVDPNVPHPDPLSASLDHRKPLVKGGGHTRDNVHLAHLRCNLQKRDREA